MMKRTSHRRLAAVCLLWLAATATADDGAPRDPITHRLESRHQETPLDLRVLPPAGMNEGREYPVLYVLPVLAGNERGYGDGLDEVTRLNLHEKHQVICVAPSFARLPWYCDHPTDPRRAQEKFFVEEVVPFIERTYPAAADRDKRWLVGFSKSGFGAFSLALRFPELFARAAAFDAPLVMASPNVGKADQEFVTQDNFDRHRLTTLLSARVNDGRLPRRMAHLGYANFGGQHEAFQRLAEGLQVGDQGVELIYHPGPFREHDWKSGWLAEAVDLLARP